MQVVKSCQQVLSKLNEFMVTEFRTLFTNKCISLTATVMPLVRVFNQVFQVFADNVNQRYGYELELQTLTPKEVESWACNSEHQLHRHHWTSVIYNQLWMTAREQFPSQQGYSHHNKPRFNHKQGASHYNKRNWQVIKPKDLNQVTTHQLSR